MGLAAFVATAVAIAAAAQPALAGVHPDFYGVNFQSQGKTEKDVSKMAGGNVRHVRLAIRWASVQPQEGQPLNWASYDNVIGDMAAHGIQVLPILIASPPWAEKNGGKPPLSSKKSRQGWKNFVTQAVNRYGQGGTFWSNPLLYTRAHPAKAPQPIPAWQVWNEVNLQHYFKAHNKVAKYADLLRLSHRAIKAGDPNATVVLSSLVGNGDPSGSLDGWTFLKKLYHKKGFSKKFDVASLHPYAIDTTYQTKWIRKFHRVMAAHHDGNKPLWLTEVSWGSAKPDKIGFNLGKKGQARMLTKDFKQLWNERHKFSIRRVYWFTFRDPKRGNARCSFCGSAGLLKSDFHPKPSWKAFKRFTG